MISSALPQTGIPERPIGGFRISDEKLDYAGDRLYWNPAFAEYPLGDQNHLFISNRRHLILTSREYQLLIASLALPSGREIGLIDEVAAVFLVNRLREVGVIGNAPWTETCTIPSFANRRDLHDENRRIAVDLSEGGEISQEFLRLAEMVGGSKKPVWVLLDDLLDPRLPDLVDEIGRNGTQLIVAIVQPERIVVWPAGSPSRWEVDCLRDALLRNRPVFKWALDKYEVHPWAPVPSGAKLQTSAWGKFMHSLRDMDLRYKSGCLISFELGTQSVEEHNFRPDPILPSQKGEICFREGGLRTCEALETLSRVETWVSPIVGPILELAAVRSTQDGLLVFRARYPRIPMGKSLPSEGDFYGTALGKGISPPQSKVSALGEGFERHDAEYTGREKVICASVDSMALPFLHPSQLKFFSEKQYAEFELHPSKVPARYSDEIPLNWTPVKSLIDGTEKWVPATFCFANTPFADEKYISFNSNGNAAGNTLAEAIVQGFLEIAERDAVAIWWYNRIERPEFCLSGLPSETHAILEKALNPEWEYWALDLTNDLQIPVLAAVGMNRDTGQVRFGFGAHFDVQIALERALTEMNQLIAVADHLDSCKFDFDRIELESFLRPGFQQGKKTIEDFPERSLKDIDDCLHECIAVARRSGFDLLFCDTTRNEGLFCTGKVIMPGACFIWPEFGNSRLYRIPVKMGWRQTELTEEELNSIPLWA